MLKVREVIYNDTVASIFRRNMTIHPNKTAFVMDAKTISFREVCIYDVNFIQDYITLIISRSKI